MLELWELVNDGDTDRLKIEDTDELWKLDEEDGIDTLLDVELVE